MHKGRHCIPNDYRYLEKISRDFLLTIKRDNYNINEINNYLNTFSDFDDDIAAKIRMNLKKNEIDYMKINDLIEELKNNVLVDIREHH